jgi:hypothetical protein
MASLYASLFKSLGYNKKKSQSIDHKTRYVIAWSDICTTRWSNAPGTIGKGELIF